MPSNPWCCLPLFHPPLESRRWHKTVGSLWQKREEKERQAGEVVVVPA